MKKMIEMDLEYMNYIDTPPAAPETLHKQACSNDEITIKSWKDQWIAQVKENHKNHGPFKDHSVGSLFGINKFKPAIIAGSGPSLKNNVRDLKLRGDIPLISCLHNFHYMVDNEVTPEYYVTLDAGIITLEEIAEGGEKELEFYLEKTKDSTLLAFIGTHPKLLESWRGKILFYNAPIPDQGVIDAINEVEKFGVFVSNGGNVLGASLYIAKAIMGSNPIAYVGADFCFSYTKQFHPWKSKYDEKLGNVMRAIDVWGNKVLTWSSYWNFKNWFDYVSLRVPGIWVNCSEGGCMGAYNEGNLRSIIQMSLTGFIQQYNICEEIRHMCENPGNAEDPVLKQVKILF
jgi:hypothetical protein